MLKLYDNPEELTFPEEMSDKVSENKENVRQTNNLSDKLSDKQDLKDKIKAELFPAYQMYDYKSPSNNNQYIIYFYREHPFAPVLAGYLLILFDGSKRYIIKWTDKGIPEVHIYTSHFLQRYKERFLKQPDLTANEVVVRYLSRNFTMKIMNVDERINRRIKEYGEYAGEGFLVQDGFCFKLSAEELMEGEELPVRISFFTTFMPLSEMSETQREAIYEECLKDIDGLD